MTLRIKNLTVAYSGSGVAVDRVSLHIPPGQIVALVGESGCGKTTVVKTLLGLLPATATATGSAQLDDGRNAVELVGRTETDWRGVRGREIAIVPQGAMAGLSPVHRIGSQLTEMIDLHGGDQAPEELLERVGLGPNLTRAYAHQLSGGMRQRVAIALALAGRPRLLIADEPTTGLDVLNQIRVLELLASLNLSTLIVSHDVAMLTAHSDRVAVMYAGRMAELRPAHNLKEAALHPYTQGLLAATPAADRDEGWASVPGMAPPPSRDRRECCAFAPRCPLVIEMCHTEEPELRRYGDGEAACHVVDAAGTGSKAAFPIHPTVTAQSRDGAATAQVRRVSHTFRGRGRSTVALRGVDLEIAPGEMVALVGESGSGKSTLARIVLGLVRPQHGDVEVDGVAVTKARRGRLRALQRRIGFVSQDPYDSLHPAMRVAALVGEPLTVSRVPRASRGDRVVSALDAVGLPADSEFLRRFPRELSGGQRQRVAIARAIVNDPVLLIADEATSMLDVSTRAGISAVLRSHATDRGLAILFITHDMGEAVQSSDRIAVLRSGELVDCGPTATLIQQPNHSYTRELLAAAATPA